MPRSLTNILALSITLAVPVILILTNVFIFMNPTWLAYQYSKADFPPSVRFTPDERYRLASESIEYIRGNRTLTQFKALDVYDEREIKHMIDVRELVDKVKIVLPTLALLIIVSLVVLAREKTNRALAARGLLNGAILTVGFFVVLGLFAAVGFQTFFTLFHKIFFEGETWLFNYTDSLIQFYPLPFWFDTSIALIALTIGEALIVGLIGWRWKT
ncbi:MAG: TIGR01906 family membrane protein [Anaerolineales bacterium]|nr:TIGR01906 family membrane protein [Anaerolineales bacterium]